MATIKWPSLPSGTSNVGLGARDIRDLKVQLQSGLGESLNFMDTNSPLKPGAAKLTTTAATLIFDDSKGTTRWQSPYLPVVRSGDSRMFSYASVVEIGGNTSSLTYLLGTPGYQEKYGAGGGTTTWIERSDTTGHAAEGAFYTSFGTEFDGVPFIHLSLSYGAPGANKAPQCVWLSTVTQGGFYYQVSNVAASAVTLTWTSIGTVSRGV
jgi:hypothetical protein